MGSRGIEPSVPSVYPARVANGSPPHWQAGTNLVLGSVWPGPVAHRLIEFPSLWLQSGAEAACRGWSSGGQIWALLGFAYSLQL